MGNNHIAPGDMVECRLIVNGEFKGETWTGQVVSVGRNYRMQSLDAIANPARLGELINLIGLIWQAYLPDWIAPRTYEVTWPDTEGMSLAGQGKPMNLFLTRQEIISVVFPCALAERVDQLIGRPYQDENGLVIGTVSNVRANSKTQKITGVIQRFDGLRMGDPTLKAVATRESFDEIEFMLIPDDRPN